MWTPVRPYLTATARAVFALGATVVLLISWWIGQGCTEAPCTLTRGNEVRGLVALAVAGTLFLRVASRRFWPQRVVAWLFVGLPAYAFNRNLEPSTVAEIERLAPDVGAVGPILILAYVILVILSLLLEWAVLRKVARTGPIDAGIR